MALGSVESQPFADGRDVTLLTCPAEYSGARVSAKKTGANPPTSSGQALGHLALASRKDWNGLRIADQPHSDEPILAL